MAAVCHLRYVVRVWTTHNDVVTFILLSPPTKTIWWTLSLCRILLKSIKYIVLIICKFSYFASLAWKCLFTDLTPEMDSHINKPQKTILAPYDVGPAYGSPSRSTSATCARDEERPNKKEKETGQWQTGSPCNTMWPGPRPTSLPSGILIHPTVWPQL